MAAPTRPTGQVHGTRTERLGRRFAGRLRRLAVLIGLFFLTAGIVFATYGGPTGWCVRKAEAALDHSDLTAARRWLDRAQSFDEDDPAAEFLRGRLSRKLGRHDVMTGHLERAVALGHEREAVERELRLAEAQSGVLADPGSELANLLVAGEDLREVCEAFVRGYILTYRLDEALRLIDVWQKDLPDDPQLHYLRGRILEHRANLDGAAAEYATALEIAPHHAPAAYNLGRVLLEMQKPEEALAQYESCARHLLNPEPALVAAARCLRELGRNDEARRYLERAERLPADRVEAAYCAVGEPLETAHAQVAEEWGRLELAENNWSEAERHFRAALEANPDDWQIRYALATALRQQNETVEAASQLKLYEETKDALAVCDRLIDDLRRNPADADARYQIGTIFLEHVSDAQGLVWLRSALTYQPDHQKAHLALADYYAQQVPESPDAARLAEQHRRLAGSTSADSTASP